jgi:hypothetical protein
LKIQKSPSWCYWIRPWSPVTKICNPCTRSVSKWPAVPTNAEISIDKSLCMLPKGRRWENIDPWPVLSHQPNENTWPCTLCCVYRSIMPVRIWSVRKMLGEFSIVLVHSCHGAFLSVYLVSGQKVKAYPV